MLVRDSVREGVPTVTCHPSSDALSRCTRTKYQGKNPGTGRLDQAQRWATLATCYYPTIDPVQNNFTLRGFLPHLDFSLSVAGGDD